MSYHVPVMMTECLSGLNIKDNGVYVDLTFGGGGHSKQIMKRLTEGSLIGFDRDPSASANAEEFRNQSFLFVSANYKHMERYLKMNGYQYVDGILADLGGSSHQIDVAERGFSTRSDGPLDMRMDQKGGLTAAKVLNDYTKGDLQKIFSAFGEVRNAATLSEVIVKSRSFGPIKTGIEFKKIVLPLAPRSRENKYLAQVFQALRIEVNQELKSLGEMLLQTGQILRKGGRLVVISYHSLEDRMVKNYMNKGNTTGEAEKDFYGNLIRPMVPVTKKPLVASEDEIRANPRSRSAKLRVAEKN